jgi:hypothetical protein
MPYRFAWLLLLALALLGCGYVGNPLPPALNIPVRIEDLRALQRGDRVEIEFTPSLHTTDDLILKSLRGIDLRGGVNPGPKFDVQTWAEHARVLGVEAKGEAPVKVEEPLGDWLGKEIVLGVRAIGPTGKPAEWSNLVVLTVIQPPQAPTGLHLVSTERGVLVEWGANVGPPGSKVRVYRQAEDEKAATLLGGTDQSTWLDQTSVFDTTYRYSVEREVPAGAWTALSPPSSPQVITPRDIFPPPAPSGLTVQLGVGTVELAWEAVTAPDWKAYRIWRAEGDASLAAYGELLTASSFSDKDIVARKKYRYAVSSIDQKGNESAPCAAVEITVQ